MKKAEVLRNLKNLLARLEREDISTPEEDRALGKVIRKMERRRKKSSVDLSTKLCDLERFYAPEHPEHTRGDWIEEVAANSTIIGYWEWLLHKLEEA